jgi:hypothetical protein
MKLSGGIGLDIDALE